MMLNRRRFLSQAGAFSGIAAGWPAEGRAQSAETVEKVLVVFKTHLDLGFTDMAAAVIRTYFDRFIPAVLDLRERIEREGVKDRYVWTTGSWLVYEYLEKASAENRRRMERAIEARDFAWHGLPFSTHTELMDGSLARLATSYAARLDRRFGRTTVAAKMTDVPCHSRGIVPVLAEAGVELLHIGANEASAIPDTPPLYVWRSPEGREVIVLIQHSYGSVAILPGGRTAVSINFTGDNRGPHTVQQIAEIYAKARRDFPNAQVTAADLNAVAAALRPLKATLPVVTEETGDTWIHGPGSDPLVMAHFRELSRLRREWIANGKLAANGDVDAAFGVHLLRVPEHTWGLSIAKLNHWDVYAMDAFRAARDLPEFRLMEKSWAEKRANVDAAVTALPPPLAAEATARLTALGPRRPDVKNARRTRRRQRRFRHRALPHRVRPEDRRHPPSRAARHRAALGGRRSGARAVFLPDVFGRGL